MKNKCNFLSVMILTIMVCLFCSCSKDKDTDTTVRHYTVAVSLAPPFVMFDGANFTGVEVEIMSAIAADQNFTYSMTQYMFADVLPNVDNNISDIAICNIYITPERLSKYVFSQPYYRAGYVLMTSADNTTINGFDDLQGKKVAIETGSGVDSFAVANQDIYGYEIVRLSDPSEVFSCVTNSTVDAGFLDTPFVQYEIACGINLKIVSEEFCTSDVAMVVQKGDDELLNAVNNGIENIKNNGKLQEILDKYF